MIGNIVAALIMSRSSWTRSYRPARRTRVHPVATAIGYTIGVAAFVYELYVAATR